MVVHYRKSYDIRVINNKIYFEEVIMTNFKVLTYVFIILTVFFLSPLNTAFSQEPDSQGNWEFLFEPYVLFTSINGDAKVGRTSGVDVDVAFEDILNVLDVGFMGHGEIFYKNSWGLVLDYGYMSLSDDITIATGGIIDGKVEQSVFEAFLAKRFFNKSRDFDIYAGIRAWDNEIKITVTPARWPGTPSTQIDESWVDIVIGARCFIPLSEKWTIMFRGDVGGFGLESDFTATADARIMYNFTDSIILDVGYKALWVDYESGTANAKGHFIYDTVTHGPLIGLIFKF